MEDCIELMRKAQKQVRDADIDVFLHYKPEVAIQIVNDLIDEPTMRMIGSQGQGGVGGGSYSTNISNTIDKETKNLAQRIKKCPNFKHYKQAASMQGTGYGNKI